MSPPVRKANNRTNRVIEASKKGRGTFEGDKPPFLTLVRRDTGEVRFLVCETLEDTDQTIASRGDKSVILFTDQYRIYDGIDEYDGIDGHLAINHVDHFVVGDAYTNSCENRHSFLRQWLGKFRGVSKHRLQGYLDFLSLLLNADAWFDQLLGRECYT